MIFETFFILFFIGGANILWHGCLIGSGKKIRKICRIESVRVDQFFSFIALILAGLLSFWIAPRAILITATLINLVLLGIFYLQPTPRISRMVYAVSSVLTVIFTVYFVFFLL